MIPPEVAPLAKIYFMVGAGIVLYWAAGEGMAWLKRKGAGKRPLLPKNAKTGASECAE